MDHFIRHYNKVRRLKYLQILVIRTRQAWQGSVNDAPFPQTSVQPRISAAPAGAHVPYRRSERFNLGSLLRFSGQGRDSSIRGIHDKRRSSRNQDFRRAIPPEVIVGATNVGIGSHLVPAISVASFSSLLLQRCRFFSRQKLFSVEFCRTL